ncbi:MAG: AraC family transcriptional regulator [Lachnospiraceae bacterium]|nr:AraC family transcriptional regulator [Lachnospiraceae bacterium]
MKNKASLSPENIVYDDPDYPVKTELVRFKNSARDSAVPHWHIDLEFLLVREGVLLLHMDGKTLELHAGQGAFVGSRKIHFLTSAKNEECCLIHILFHPVLLGLHSVIEKRYVLPLRASLSCVLLKAEVPWQKEILDHIDASYHIKDAAGALLGITGRMFLIWELLYENCPISQKLADSYEAKMSALRNMMDFIYTNYEKKISLEDIAKAGNMCKTQCTQVFRDFVGLTPVEYLISQRLSKSTELFCDAPDLTMTEVALACGFSSSSYYAESFRDHYGCTPTEYKKRQETK